MMRSIFRGVIGFGLVAIPIQVYKAMESDHIDIHWLHRVCHNRIRYQKYCPVCDVVVEPDDLVKGVELPDGRTVVLPPDENPEPEADERSITILAFPRLADVDPVYYETAYWLKPAPGGTKPYALLVEALRQEERVALAEMRLRARRSLAVVRAYNERTLMLHRMYYPEHLRVEGQEFGPTTVELSEKERQLARTLIQVMAEPFRPERYPNEERARKLALIESLTPAAVKPSGVVANNQDVIDLMERLKASVSQIQAEREVQ